MSAGADRRRAGTQLALAAGAALALALSLVPGAEAAEGCANQSLRAQSAVAAAGPDFGKAYSTLLPECRAYELVSPLGTSAISGIDEDLWGAELMAAPGGSGQTPAVAFGSPGALASEPPLGAMPNGTDIVPYLAHRTQSGWASTAMVPPGERVSGGQSPSLSEEPIGDLTATMGADAVCNTASGHVSETGGTPIHAALACVQRASGAAGVADGAWLGGVAEDGLYEALEAGASVGWPVTGSSADLSHVVFQATRGTRFSPEDPLSGGGLYEVEALGTVAAKAPRLVNVGPAGQPFPEAGGSAALGGGEDHLLRAVSSDGKTVFFTVSEPALEEEAGKLFHPPAVIYARISHTSTVAISEPEPSECTVAGCAAEYPAGWPAKSQAPNYRCDFAERAAPSEHPACRGVNSAQYLAAAESGERVFFESEQQLIDSASRGAPNDQEPHLYAYDFKSAHRFTNGSEEATQHIDEIAGGRYRGVVAASADGSHVYFVTFGALQAAETGWSESEPKALSEENAEHESAREGQYNMYVFDAASEETHFVCGLSSADASSLWQPEAEPAAIGAPRRRAQVTPDGRFLVFDTFASPDVASAEAKTDGAQQVYRYEAESASHEPTGRLVRISVGHRGYSENGNGNGVQGLPALVAPPARPRFGAYPSAGDWDRAISGLPGGEADGSYVLFESAEQLQAEDGNSGAAPGCENPNLAEFAAAAGGLGSATGCDAYLWHEKPCAASAEGCGNEDAGEVSLISQGTGVEGIHVYPAMSGSGQDVYFVTSADLLPQDKGQLPELYDARVEGGFPYAQATECAGEGCKPGASPQRESFPFVYSAGFVGPGNVLSEPVSAPRPSVAVLAHALKGQRIVLTLRTSVKGTVTVSGPGVRRARRALPAGVHRLKLRLTAAGLRALRHHHKLKLRLAIAASAVTTRSTATISGVRQRARRRR